MVVQLLKSARINHEAGEIVEVSPAQGDFLLAIGSAIRFEPTRKPAEPVKEVEVETAVKEPVKRPGRKATKK